MPDLMIDIVGRIYSLTERVEGEHYTAALVNDKGDVYRVDCHHGAWTCNCPDSTYRVPHNQCKHVFRLRARLEERAREQAEQTPAASLPPKQAYQEQLRMSDTNSSTLTKANDNGPIEQALIQGNLANLSPEQRLHHYLRVCESLGLNPHTSPFDYLTFQGKLRLYAKRDCTDQLRRINGITIVGMSKAIQDGILTVCVEVEDKNGRRDVDEGAVVIAGLKGDALANAHMKAVTKAKRRATLSICGLGWLDESETETVPGMRIDTEKLPVVVREQAQLPAASVQPVPPGNETPEPATSAKAAKPPPQDGAELEQRLRNWEAKLVEKKACQPGDLLTAVRVACVGAGYVAEMVRWPGPALVLAREEAKKFVARLKAGAGPVHAN